VINAIFPQQSKKIWPNISVKVMAKKSSNAINVIMLQVEDEIILDFSPKLWAIFDSRLSSDPFIKN